MSIQFYVCNNIYHSLMMIKIIKFKNFHHIWKIRKELYKILYKKYKYTDNILYKTNEYRFSRNNLLVFQFEAFSID